MLQPIRGYSLCELNTEIRKSSSCSLGVVLFSELNISNATGSAACCLRILSCSGFSSHNQHSRIVFSWKAGN